MTEEGTLSIVRQAHRCHIRYATNNPYTLDRQLSADVNEAHVGTFLQQCGVDPWSIQRACTELQHGRMAVLPIVGSPAQIQGSFLVAAAGDAPTVHHAQGTTRQRRYGEGASYT